MIQYLTVYSKETVPQQMRVARRLLGIKGVTVLMASSIPLDPNNLIIDNTFTSVIFVTTREYSYQHTTAQEQQSALEAAVVFLDSVVTQVSAAHLQPERAPHPGILRELEQLLLQARGPIFGLGFRI